jgi:hypothetical protein
VACCHIEHLQYQRKAPGSKRSQAQAKDTGKPQGKIINASSKKRHVLQNRFEKVLESPPELTGESSPDKDSL